MCPSSPPPNISCAPKRVCGSRVWCSGRILLSHPPQFRDAAMGGLAQGRIRPRYKPGGDAGRCPTRCHASPRRAPALASCAHLSCCPLPGAPSFLHPPPKHTPVLPQAWPQAVWGPRPGTSLHGQVGNWEHWFPRDKTRSSFAGAMVTCSDREADGCNESVCTFSTSGVSLSHCTYI